MSEKVLTREESRWIDVLAVEKYGIPGIVLMENAGRGITDCLLRYSVTGPVILCCGKGNNGGDGLVVARHLWIRGHQPIIWLFAEPDMLSPDAATNYQIAKKLGIPICLFPSKAFQEEATPRLVWNSFVSDLSGADWIVDALLGTGSRGKPTSPVAEVILEINGQKDKGTRILAVDLPSGLDADTGFPYNPTVRADLTCTMVAKKTGFLAKEAVPFLGEIQVFDIGLPNNVL